MAHGGGIDQGGMQRGQLWHCGDQQGQGRWFGKVSKDGRGVWLLVHKRSWQMSDIGGDMIMPMIMVVKEQG